MENNKYYTPTIEEFHVGFEFEMNDTWGGWKPIILTEELLKNPMVGLGSGNERSPYYWKTRVKCLDKEDIESLDWKPFGGEGNPYCLLCKNGNCFYLWMTSNIISINKGLVGGLIENSDQIFRGYIKNKSELKFIMSCLKISKQNI